uniref:Fatty acid desaturase 6 n=1 Tax=Neogobius melanostomus TaxID=47308 RepID=A0A8C6TWJ2_9GOBI
MEANTVPGESLMMELNRLVQEEVKRSSWWELRGKDCTILGLAFMALPLRAAALALASARPVGALLLGVCHAVITIKGTHLSSHSGICLWCLQVGGAFSADAAVHGHVKFHHAHTNVLGLGDSSLWKVPSLSREVYLFIAPLAVPVITPLVAVAHLRGRPFLSSLRTVLLISLGLCSHLWILLDFCGFSFLSALCCMFLTRSIFSIPYIHVNIFQHIGLSMFSPEQRPKRIHQMTHGVLNLPRNPLLDWTFGHSLISCHIEHHLFPSLSDNMCLKVQPVVRRFLKQKSLPYQQDLYLSRLRLFFHQYRELMVLARPSPSSWASNERPGIQTGDQSEDRTVQEAMMESEERC